MAKSIICRGRVQGVFFRESTKQEAKNLEIRGWVRNEENGSVAIHAEGKVADMIRLIQWCYHGPIMANVTSVDVVDCEDEGFVDFEVRR